MSGQTISANASAILSVDGGATLDQGQPAFYFDFGPVLERSRALSSHPERVQLMCENCVKRLAPGDIMLPQATGFFLVVFSVEGMAAETLAQEINIALLELFFGTDTVSQNLSNICRRATLKEINEKGIKIPPAPKKAASKLDRVETDPLARLAKGGLPGYEGLTTGFAPVINLERERCALYLCGAVRSHKGRTLFGQAALSGINPRDRASLDEAMLEYSLASVRSAAAAAAKPADPIAIVTPVHYETLAWSRGRQLYQKALRNAGVADNPFLLLKLEGIPTGTPAARLSELISMVRPFVRRIFVELPEWNAGMMRGGHLGVAGFMGALPDHTGPGSISLEAAARAVSNLVQFASAQHAVACVSNIGSPNQLALARSAGARFIIRSTETGVIQTGLVPEERVDQAA